MHTEESKGGHSRGTRTQSANNLPRLLTLSYQHCPLPVNNNYPFCPLPGESTLHADGSYSMKIYLPTKIFLLTLKFDCLLEGSSDVLPKITESTSKKLEIDLMNIQRETYEYHLTIGDMPLIDYLRNYGAGVENVNEFIAIYERAPKSIQSERPLGTAEEQKRPDNLPEHPRSSITDAPILFQRPSVNNQPNPSPMAKSCVLL